METVSCVTEGSPSDAGSRAHVADPPVCAGRRTDQLHQLTQQIQVSLKQMLMFAVSLRSAQRGQRSDVGSRQI